jgi:DNA-directed RNA polymerase specialized sigma24 family protein
MSMPGPKGDLNFDADVLPHVDAAYNLARWLTRNEQDAEDVDQEAFLRAFRFFGGCRGANTRAWLLGIVRNTCYTRLQRNRRRPTIEFDETLFRPDCATPNPEDCDDLSTETKPRRTSRSKTSGLSWCWTGSRGSQGAADKHVEPIRKRYI